MLAIFRATTFARFHDMNSKVQYHSRAISKRLMFVVSQEIVALEIEILSEIDKLIFGHEGIERRNPIGI